MPMPMYNIQIQTNIACNDSIVVFFSSSLDTLHEFENAFDKVSRKSCYCYKLMLIS